MSFDDLHCCYVLSNAIDYKRSAAAVKKDVCDFGLPAFICGISCHHNQREDILNETQTISTLFIVDRSRDGTVDQFFTISIRIYSLLPFGKSDHEMPQIMSSSKRCLTFTS